MEFLRDGVFSDIRMLFGPDGVILAPDQWPEDVAKIVTGFNAGTSATISFESRVAMAFKLLEYLPDGSNNPWPRAADVQASADKLLMDLR